jgi:hypothetical protein
MKIYLLDQKSKFEKHLDFLKKQPIMEYDKSTLKEKISIVEIQTTKKIEELNLDFLFKYQIFPDKILTFTTQWTVENRRMKLGDTIAQQVYIPPIKLFSQKIVFGVRINEIIDEDVRKGFSYETLEGHVEKGISTFTIEQLENQIIFKIHTFSSPGNRLTKLLAPIFSIPYQTYCTNKALKNVKQQIEGL